jgi:hypothetical protein
LAPAGEKRSRKRSSCFGLKREPGSHAPSSFRRRGRVGPRSRRGRHRALRRSTSRSRPPSQSTPGRHAQGAIERTPVKNR